LRLGKCANITEDAIPLLEQLTQLIDLDVSETGIRKDVAKEKFSRIPHLKV
jgi:hypothetical protein